MLTYGIACNTRSKPILISMIARRSLGRSRRGAFARSGVQRLGPARCHAHRGKAAGDRRVINNLTIVKAVAARQELRVRRIASRHESSWSVLPKGLARRCAAISPAIPAQQFVTMCRSRAARGDRADGGLAFGAGGAALGNIEAGRQHRGANAGGIGVGKELGGFISRRPAPVREMPARSTAHCRS